MTVAQQVMWDAAGDSFHCLNAMSNLLMSPTVLRRQQRGINLLTLLCVYIFRQNLFIMLHCIIASFLG